MRNTPPSGGRRLSGAGFPPRTAQPPKQLSRAAHAAPSPRETCYVPPLSFRPMPCGQWGCRARASGSLRPMRVINKERHGFSRPTSRHLFKNPEDLAPGQCVFLLARFRILLARFLFGWSDFHLGTCALDEQMCNAPSRSPKGHPPSTRIIRLLSPP